MKKKNLFATIIWFVVAIIWMVLLVADSYSQDTMGLFVMRILCVLFSIVSALVNLMKHKEQNHKQDGEKE